MQKHAVQSSGLCRALFTVLCHNRKGEVEQEPLKITVAGVNSHRGQGGAPERDDARVSRALELLAVQNLHEDGGLLVVHVALPERPRGEAGAR